MLKIIRIEKNPRKSEKQLSGESGISNLKGIKELQDEATEDGQKPFVVWERNKGDVLRWIRQVKDAGMQVPSFVPVIYSKNPKRKRKSKKKIRKVIVNRKKSRRKKKRVIRARKNPPIKRRYETIIVGLVKFGKRYKRLYFTGRSFVRDKGEAKVFPGSLGKVEAKRILSLLPDRVERLYVERA